MKKITHLHTVIAIGAVIVIHASSCQTISAFTGSDTSIAKIIISNENSVMTINAGKDYLNAINLKVIRAFVKHFKDAKNVSWRKTYDGGYVAQFTKDAVQTIVRYDYNGHRSYTVKKYAEKCMSPELRALIKDTYFDYDIKEVTEILLPFEQHNIYCILIKKAGYYKMVRIYNREIEIINEFTEPV